MASISVVKENIIKGGKRFLKVFEFGVKTADVAAPFGDDSVPLVDMIAIYAKTAENGDNVVVGYLNKNQIATEGEKRIFSVNPSDGSLSFDVYLKTDGTCELGGNVDNAVRYLPLNSGLQQETLAINAELAKIAAVLNSIVPGSYVVTPVTVDISQSKIEEIKTL